MMDTIVNKLNENLTYSELIKVVDEFETAEPRLDKRIKIGISSNLTVESSQYFLKKQAILKNVSCEVSIGDYDSHINSVNQFVEEAVDVIIIQNLFDNLLPSFESTVSTMSEEQVEEVVNKVAQEMRLCLQKAENCKTVFIDRFYPVFRRDKVVFEPRLEEAIEKLNQVLENLIEEFENLRLMDPGTIAREMGTDECVNPRFYYRYKALYTNKFWDGYSKQILLATRYGQSYFYKVIVLDCDNTLWGGIIGEDLINGIDLNPHDYPGNIYWKVQNELLEMQKQGILICLCSKNNPEDVQEVLDKHEFQVIKSEDILLKKVNWNNKVQNISELADELDLGLDSFIFIDDSDFEIASVKEMLPQVTTLQVPKKIHEYPKLIEQIRELVLSGGLSESSKKKTEQYKQRAKTLEERSKHGSFEDYLSALEIKVRIELNEEERIKRISELTQKSNQFNLTTRRYTEAEISGFMSSKESDVFSIHVQDKFGDSGLTGIVIVKREGEEALVDSFLMSCRVIGRTIEFSMWQSIFAYLKKQGCQTIKTTYLKTPKNSQVKEFYEKLGLEVSLAEDAEKNYTSAIDKLMDASVVKNIKVNYDF